MHNFSHFKKKSRRLYRSLDNRQRTILFIITASSLVLLIGGIVLFFTRDAVPQKKEIAIKETCVDSDSDNIHTKGAVTYTDAAGKHVDEDYCSPEEGSVFEMVCYKDSFWSLSSKPKKETIGCPKGCVNGMCRK